MGDSVPPKCIVIVRIVHMAAISLFVLNRMLILLRMAVWTQFTFADMSVTLCSHVTWFGPLQRYISRCCHLTEHTHFRSFILYSALFLLGIWRQCSYRTELWVRMSLAKTSVLGTGAISNITRLPWLLSVSDFFLREKNKFLSCLSHCS